jgi:hypothetical protein
LTFKFKCDPKPANFPALVSRENPPLNGYPFFECSGIKPLIRVSRGRAKTPLSDRSPVKRSFPRFLLCHLWQNRKRYKSNEQSMSNGFAAFYYFFLAANFSGAGVYF